MKSLKYAMRYGYSNARVKAMESKLISGQTMKSMAETKGVDSMLSILFQTDYNAAITKFGGLDIGTTLLDFAVSDNMASRLNKLAQITPKGDQRIVRGIIARWDLENIKLVLEAVDRRMPFDSISRYIIGSGSFGETTIRDAVSSGSVEDAIARLMRSSRTYRKMLALALRAYNAKGSIFDAIAAIDVAHYAELGEIAELLKGMKDKSALLISMDIDMRNMLTMMRAKRKRMPFDSIKGSIINGGSMSSSSLSRMYNSSEDMEALSSRQHVFNLHDAVSVYKEKGHMLVFEVAMRNQIFNASRKLLRSSVLSLGTLVDYVYLKEIEVFTLRALSKAKEYGLTKDEVSGLIVWNL